jgi:hypothetical protein
MRKSFLRKGCVGADGLRVSGTVRYSDVFVGFAILGGVISSFKFRRRTQKAKRQQEGAIESHGLQLQLANPTLPVANSILT